MTLRGVILTTQDHIERGDNDDKQQEYDAVLVRKTTLCTRADDDDNDDLEELGTDTTTAVTSDNGVSG